MDPFLVSFTQIVATPEKTHPSSSARVYLESFPSYRAWGTGLGRAALDGGCLGWDVTDGSTHGRHKGDDVLLIGGTVERPTCLRTNCQIVESSERIYFGLTSACQVTLWVTGDEPRSPVTVQEPE